MHELPDPRPTCVRCTGTSLTANDPAGSSDLTFWSCPSCHRAFALQGDVLTERWLGPLSVALYCVIFVLHPQSAAAATVRSLDHLGPRRLELMADEIELELAHPSQPVSQILPGMQATEADLREFLGLVAARIRAQPKTDR